MAEAQADAAQMNAEAVAVRAVANAPQVVMKCLDKNSPVTTKVDSAGRVTMYVCESYGQKLALTTLKSVRKAIAADRSMSAADRAEALGEIDAELAELAR